MKDHFSFVHITDIHMNPNPKKLTNKRFVILLRDILPKLDPEAVVVSGDIGNSISIKGHTLPNEKEWQFYESSLRKYNYFDPNKWLDVRGNHDAWDCTSHEKKYYLKYSVYGYYNKGRVYEQSYDYKEGKIRFISVDATLGPLKAFSGMCTTEDLNILEEMFKRNNSFIYIYICIYSEYYCTIVFCHYPLFTMDTRPRSSSGLSFYDLIHIYRPNLYLNGHIHSALGRNASVIHSCNVTEIQSPEFKIIGLFRVFSIRNGYIYWNTYRVSDWNKKPLLFLCNPMNGIKIDNPMNHYANLLPNEIYLYTLSQQPLQTTQLYINKHLIEASSVDTYNDCLTIRTYTQNTSPSTPSVTSASSFHYDIPYNLKIRSVDNKGRVYKYKHEDNTIDIYSPPFSFYKFYMYIYTWLARTIMHTHVSLFIDRVPSFLTILVITLFTISFINGNSILHFSHTSSFPDPLTPSLYISNEFHIYDQIKQSAMNLYTTYLPTSMHRYFDWILDSIPSFLPSIRQRYQNYFDIYSSLNYLPSLPRFIVAKWLLIFSDPYIYISMILGIISYIICPQNIIKGNGQRYCTTLWGFINLNTKMFIPGLDNLFFTSLWCICQYIIVCLYLFLFYALPVPHYLMQPRQIVIRSILKVILFLMMLYMSSYGKPIRSLIEGSQFFFSFTDIIRPTLFLTLMIRELIMA
ncbi:hypothetical protein WA158_006402 [Blastocystis sp. Blastoise]